MSKAIKIETIAKPVAVYRSEMWAVTEMDMNSLSTWERKILRMMYRPLVEQGIWRKRTIRN